MHSNIKHEHNVAQIKLWKKKLLNENTEYSDISAITTYLLNVENWGYYELVLFNNNLNFFTRDHLKILYRIGKKKSKLFNDLTKIKKIDETITLNLLEIFIERNYLDDASRLIQFIEESVDFKVYKNKIRFTFLYGKYQLKTSEIEQGKANCKKVLEIFMLLQDTDNYSLYSSEYEKVLATIELE